MNIFEGKDVLVTGGTGSIGAELVHQLLAFSPRVIRVFDNNESGHFHLRQKVGASRVRHLVGDIRDRERLMRAMDGIHIVFHAAALKHVDICEYNPFEAVSTNVIGTKNIIDVAIAKGVEKVLTISTDKAVNPINTMGATKLLSEKITTNPPLGPSRSQFACVRFGNVLNSVGSVIPIFQKQIETSNFVTITSDKMTRFFMTIHDAVSLVLRSAAVMNGGETFILKMDAIKITDLAEVLIQELAPRFGKTRQDFSFKTIGVRAGEKLHEHLLTIEEAASCREMDDMYVIHKNHQLAIDHENTTVEERYKRCQSQYSPLLTVGEIRALLYEKQILSK